MGIDERLFVLLNGTLHNTFFDWFMPLITKSSTVLHFVVAMLLVYLIFQKFSKTAIINVLTYLVVFGLADSITHRILKPFFGRVRPCNPAYFFDGVNNYLINSRLLLGYKTSFSMPSNHASNMFAMATFWSLLYPKSAKFLFPIAFVITYSRLYVGVHYPFDLLFGSIVGSAIAISVYLLFEKQLRFVNES